MHPLWVETNGNQVEEKSLKRCNQVPKISPGIFNCLAFYVVFGSFCVRNVRVAWLNTSATWVVYAASDEISLVKSTKRIPICPEKSVKKMLLLQRVIEAWESIGETLQIFWKRKNCENDMESEQRINQRRLCHCRLIRESQFYRNYLSNRKIIL